MAFVEPAERGAELVDALGHALAGQEAQVLPLAGLRDVAFVADGIGPGVRSLFLVQMGGDAELAKPSDRHVALALQSFAHVLHAWALLGRRSSHERATCQRRRASVGGIVLATFAGWGGAYVRRRARSGSSRRLRADGAAIPQHLRRRPSGQHGARALAGERAEGARRAGEELRGAYRGARRLRRRR